MNSIHLVTQEKYRVENQYEKPNRVHEHPAGTPRCAQAVRPAPRPCAQRPGRAPHACCRAPAARAQDARVPAARAPAACAPAASSPRALQHACASARAPATPCVAYSRSRAHVVPLPARTQPPAPRVPHAPRLRAQRQHTQRLPAQRPARPAPTPSAVSWPVLRHSPAAHCSSCHNTIFVLRYKLLAAKPPEIQSCNTTEPSSLQYKKLYCNIVSKPTTPILQYNPSLNQPPRLQYKPSIAIQFSQ